MKILLQRTNKASVIIEEEVVGEIGKGYVLMVGIEENDSEENMTKAIDKITNLRLFENDENKFDKSLLDVNGQVLLISQFTLFADVSKGNRPYFGGACKPDKAKKLFKDFVLLFENKIGKDKVSKGEFGKYMIVEIENDGPVTIPLAFS